ASVARKHAVGKEPRGVLPPDELELLGREQPLEVAQLGPASVHRQIRAPHESLDAHRRETALEHAAVHAAARQIHGDVRDAGKGGKRVLPIAPAASPRWISTRAWVA